jgi:hypothetical protein
MTEITIPILVASLIVVLSSLQSIQAEPSDGA